MNIRMLLLFFLFFSQSQADDSLSQITARLEKTPITQGKFQQEKHLKFLHKPLLSTGSFTYDKSKGVIWKTLSPVPSLLLVNDTQLLTAQGEQAVPPAFGRVFKALLGGEISRLSEGFTIEGKEEKTGWQLQLTPKDELLKKAISTIQLTGDTELRELKIQETNGNISQIRFSEITHPDQLSKADQSDFERLSP
jgi:outer membrane lipoprotein-sorting protein